MLKNKNFFHIIKSKLFEKKYGGKVRYFVVGPLTGITLGIIYTFIGFKLWIKSGIPDFFFKCALMVMPTLIAEIINFCIILSLIGILIIKFDREIIIIPYYIFVISAFSIICYKEISYDFKVLYLTHYSEIGAIISSLICAVLFSKKRNNKNKIL